ncbi:XRE family transcriptional regulator [Microbacterium sp. Se63.02b]|nr:XRE family transcriptional regulator [Microbacterium sp. Se63.02b]QYM66097.1 XRE family transcriptional regulator [Microbacterium sp. Se5.02b]
MASTVEGARIHAGVSFPCLSELTGIAPGQLADLLDGRADFTLVDLAGIAAALDLPVTALLPAAMPDGG